MTTVLDRPPEAQTATGRKPPEDCCHISRSSVGKGLYNPYQALCGYEIPTGEDPCCGHGYPSCGRPRCVDCLAIAQEFGAPGDYLDHWRRQ
jgi:hypothetical protein